MRDLTQGIPGLDALQLPLRTLIASPGPVLLEQAGSGLGGFLNLGDLLLVGGLTDPAFTPPDGSNGDAAVAAFSHAGRVNVTAPQYARLVAAAQLDAAVALADIQTSQAGKGRHAKAVQRTAAYLADLATADTGVAVLAPVVGGPFVALREQAAKSAAAAVAKHDAAGFALEGFNQGNELAADLSLIRTVLVGLRLVQLILFFWCCCPASQSYFFFFKSRTCQRTSLGCSTAAAILILSCKVCGWASTCSTACK
jgi:hypothetical protein